MVHPFWQTSLQHLVQQLEPTVNEDMRESLRRSIVNFTSTFGVDNRPPTAGGSDQAIDHTDNRSGEFKFL